jgi:hypothetical protein
MAVRKRKGASSFAVNPVYVRKASSWKSIEDAGDPPPPTDDFPNLPLIAELFTVDDWNSVLDIAPGSMITDESGGRIHFYQPGDGERTEVQVHQDPSGGVNSHGFEAIYVWDFLIPASLDWHDPNHNIINQMHGNNNAGYTGGIRVLTDTEEIEVAIKGGIQTDSSGSHRYEFEYDQGANALPEGATIFGQLERDTRHTIHYHAHWTDKWDGFIRVQLDDNPIVEIYDVPTSSNIADTQMFRLGFYPGSDSVPGPLNMDVWDTTVYGQAVPYP